MHDALRRFVPAAQRRFEIELQPFDEFSSLALLRRKYMFCVATRDADLFEQVSCLLEGHARPYSPVSPTKQKDHGGDAGFETGSEAKNVVLLATKRKRIQLLHLKIDALERRMKSLECCASNTMSNEPTAMMHGGDTFCVGEDIYIMEATSRDIDGIRAVLQDGFGPYAALNGSVRKWVKRMMRDISDLDKHFSKKSKSKFLVARKDSEVIACAGLKCRSAKMPSSISGDVASCDDKTGCELGELAHVAVLSRMRRRGIASMLSSHLIQYASSQGIRYVDLSVTQQQKEAKTIYSKLGFELVSKTEISADCIVEHMRLEL
jgi:N-acetylglutamate synthase-like GNAT family acetyltransferase